MTLTPEDIMKIESFIKRLYTTVAYERNDQGLHVLTDFHKELLTFFEDLVGAV